MSDSGEIEVTVVRKEMVPTFHQMIGEGQSVVVSDREGGRWAVVEIEEDGTLRITVPEGVEYYLHYGRPILVREVRNAVSEPGGASQ